MGRCMAKTNHDGCRRGSFFVTYCTGLPLPGSPLVYPSPIPPSTGHESPTSLWKGRGGCTCVLASEGLHALEVEPTSLRRGEGLVVVVIVVRYRQAGCCGPQSLRLIVEVVVVAVVVVLVAVVVVPVVITRPTSLNRGEGHLARLLCVVGHELGW